MAAPIPGTYIATNLLYAPVMHKVGHTSDLGRRLHDGTYTTAFTTPWSYEATFETASTEDAEMLEHVVLEACNPIRKREGCGREIVVTTTDAIKRLLAVAAKLVGIRGQFRDAPEYPAPPSRASPFGGTARGSVPAGTLTAVSAAARELGIGRRQYGKHPAIVFDAADGTHASVVKALAKLREDADEDARANEDEVGDIGDVEPQIPEFGGCEPPLWEYQKEAVDACVTELIPENAKTMLIVACRCGKTRIAYEIMKQYTRVLFLVPTIQLLWQTAAKLIDYGLDKDSVLLVGSDTRCRDGLRMIAGCEHAAKEATRNVRVVVSMYQSSHHLDDNFELTVFDECHRVCRPKKPRVVDPFSHVLKKFKYGRRLFMTATPRYGGNVSMDDREIFGNVAFRFHLRSGIDRGIANDFRLHLVAPDAGTSGDDALVSQIVAASRISGKLLVFCSRIADSDRLCGATRVALADHPGACLCMSVKGTMTSAIKAECVKRFKTCARGILFNCRLFSEGIEFPHLNGVFFAAPRSSPCEIIQSVCRPLTRVAGKPPRSDIFIPVVSVAGTSADGLLDIDLLCKFAPVVPFVDALLDEDPLFYRKLMGEGLRPDEVFSIRSSAGPILGSRRDVFVRYLSRVIRYNVTGSNKMTMSKNIPFDIAFAHLRFLVDEVGRYPKTGDVWYVGGVPVVFKNWMSWVLGQYENFKGSKKSSLQPFQVRQLESLKYWQTRRATPFPSDVCMEMLRNVCEATRRDDIARGLPADTPVDLGRTCPISLKEGHIIHEQTKHEMLAGWLNVINEQDYFIPGPGGTNKKDLESLTKICKKYGLTYPRPREHPDGRIVTKNDRPDGFIQRMEKAFMILATRSPDDPYIVRNFPRWSERSASSMERSDLPVALKLKLEAPTLHRKSIKAINKKLTKIEEIRRARTAVGSGQEFDMLWGARIIKILVRNEQAQVDACVASDVLKNVSVLVAEMRPPKVARPRAKPKPACT